MAVTEGLELTPAMRQYLEIKERYPDCILFFRMGDFYEMFFDDALLASRILEITLTSRNKDKEGAIPLCGVPYHAGATYMAKLIAVGHKVAVCEQLEDPRQAKGVVKRDVVRIVTPGLVVDPENLAEKENNFLGALMPDEERTAYGLAFLDISTGEFRVAETADRADFLAQIAGLALREVIVPAAFRDSGILKTLQADGSGSLCRVNELPVGEVADGEAARVILEDFLDSDAIARSGILTHPAAARAAAAILHYVGETQKDHLGHINEIGWYRAEEHLVLDEDVKRNLELFGTLSEGAKEGSLFHVLDETMTPMGGRRLRWWLNYPLRVPERISARLAVVSEIKDRHLLRESLRRALDGMADLERIGARIVMKTAHGRDLAALRGSLARLPAVREVLAELEAPLAITLREQIDPLADIRELLEQAVADEPPLSLREGGLIREGYDAELDQLIAASRDGKQWIASLEEKERRRTGIGSLRVGFNNVFGYYIEVTKANAANVPGDYVRKQTLVNAERYINEELKQFEATILSADERRREREYELFTAVRDEVGAQIRRLQRTAARIADLDALQSLAEVAERYGYCRPEVDAEDVIEIRDGRHPVVERMHLPEGFVPNDVHLDCAANRLLLITGPNMAGKSTFIRQVALIILMAQAGSFVPAASARIGVADRIFTRIGAMDNLARGQSTFLVEMNEAAHILAHATRRSLVILDEVGRGTSTFDGLSIAWAMAEHLHDAPQLGCRTLFATHYHQLTELATLKPGVKNFHVAVKEWDGRIIFLHKILPGATNRSYGIEVARIAGVPDEVIRRAREVLQNYEHHGFEEVGLPRRERGKRASLPTHGVQLDLFMNEEQTVLQELRDLSLAETTPLAALNKLDAWQRMLSKE